MAELLTTEHFEPHQGEVFSVQGTSYALTLASVERVAGGLPGLREPFNLIFTGPPQPILPEGLYTFTAGAGTSFQLYVMPIHTASRERQDYQAMFN